MSCSQSGIHDGPRTLEEAIDRTLLMAVDVSRLLIFVSKLILFYNSVELKLK
jgi:hypothetical protein